ncbi:MAG: 30S ribosomal protein S9 [Chloroflexi bacterium]|nr:30S ribosomal protein S9 [Chloroflexota bacterium]
MSEERVRYYATGRRKNATAKVWVKPGTGQILVNGRSLAQYVCRPSLEMLVREPLVMTDNADRYDIVAKALGGGITGQAGAIRHGISKALVVMDEEYRPRLRRAGLLTRDPRVKERKKYGFKRARRGFQFSKR